MTVTGTPGASGGTTRSVADPPLVCVYGPAGCGKTADKIWAAPQGLFFAGPGALAPGASIVGYTPTNVVEVHPVEGDITWLRRVAREKIQRTKPKLIVVDDFSMVLHRTARREKPKYKDARQLYGTLRHLAGEMFDEWRGTGATVLVDCHELEPDWEQDKDGKRTGRLNDLGTPDLPGRKSAPDMIKAFDMVYRVIRDGMRRPWPYVYAGGPFAPDAHLWRTKDRWTRVTVHNGGQVPMNLGEILRSILELGASGWAYPRAPGCEWMEEVVAWGAAGVAGGHPLRAVGEQIKSQLTQTGREDWEVRWVLRDYVARVELAKCGSALDEFRF